MNVLNVKRLVSFFVETDDHNFGGDYRRGENGGWEQRMGESWETVYDDTEIEAAFQEWTCSNVIYTTSFVV
jgi:hypothetical protein